jgi:hypothetical protein
MCFKRNKNRLQMMSAWTAAVLVSALLTGCNMFEPREPQDPGGNDDKIDFVPANDAAGVFVNLRSGVENLLEGANYERSLADNFNFVPLDQDVIDLPNVDWSNWTRDVEMSVLRLMLSESSAATVTFNRTPLQSTNDWVQFQVTYKLELTSATTSLVTAYEGVAQFDVRRTGGIWELELWKETAKVGSETTWGYLKGTLKERLDN